jgi:hypothetical protein
VFSAGTFSVTHTSYPASRYFTRPLPGSATQCSTFAPPAIATIFTSTDGCITQHASSRRCGTRNRASIPATSASAKPDAPARVAAFKVATGWSDGGNL